MERSKRNCDRFDTFEQANEAYDEECCYWFGGYDGVCGTYIRKKGAPSFERWLFKEVKEARNELLSDEKNALAKLSAYLAMYRDFHKDEDRVNDHILTKAQRIVAELAKVEDRRDGETNSDVLWRCNDCIAKCRAIAEEGAEDGK